MMRVEHTGSKNLNAYLSHRFVAVDAAGLDIAEWTVADSEESMFEGRMLPWTVKETPEYWERRGAFAERERKTRADKHLGGGEVLAGGSEGGRCGKGTGGGVAGRGSSSCGAPEATFTSESVRGDEEDKEPVIVL